jgi:hypothetical protein
LLPTQIGHYLIFSKTVFRFPESLSYFPSLFE